MKVCSLLILPLLLFLLSCSNSSVSTYEEYVAWLNDEDNGLVATKKSNGITIKVKYIPPDYLAYQELQGQSRVKKAKIDSLVESYNKSLTFLMTIGVDGKLKEGDVMFQDVRDYESYKERLYAMNFDVEHLTTLKLGNKTYRPVLSGLENVYGLTESRNITLVFVPEEQKEKVFYASESLQFSFDDEIFNTGINHFTFSREDLDNVPSFIFWN